MTIPNIDSYQLETLARCIWAEARGESVRGRLAVGKVILNRVKDRRWPSTIAEVVWQPKQFSAFNEDDPNRRQLLALPIDSSILVDCRLAAQMALSPHVGDETEGANHYLTAALAERAPPAWFDESKVTARIGAHVFLKL